MNVWKCKLIFPTDTLQQKIEITALKTFLASENTECTKCSNKFGHHCMLELWEKKKLDNYVIKGYNYGKKSLMRYKVIIMTTSKLS